MAAAPGGGDVGGGGLVGDKDEVPLPPPLADIGVCKPCALRLSGCRDPERYFAACAASVGAPSGGATSSSAPPAAAAAAAAGEEDVCGLCCGLLERGGELRAALRARLAEAGFEDARAYTLGVVLPVLCVFRHHILLSLLRDKAPQSVSDCVDLKDTIRSLLSAELSEQGLAPAGSSGDTEEEGPAVTIEAACAFAHPAALRELACLDALGGGRRKPQRESRRKRRKLSAASASAGAGGALGTGEEEPAAAAAAAPEASTASATAVAEALGGLGAEECLALLGPGPASLAERLRRIPAPSRPEAAEAQTSSTPSSSSTAPSSAVAAVKFTLGRESLYLRGRYVKLSRNMPQSPWVIDGDRKGESSVEECLCVPAAKAFGASEVKFHAEGREDIDVRMLGAGRTFVIEVKNAKRARPTGEEDLAADIRAASEGLVYVSGGLSRCSASAMATLQRDAENHRKTYMCLCWSPKPLEESDLEPLKAHRDLEIQQKTPVRVLHRRPQAVRPRTLHWMEPVYLNAHYFRLRINTQAGMYIKEFVHGDLGRTRPSLRELLGGVRVEILQLDVEGVIGAEEKESCA